MPADVGNQNITLLHFTAANSVDVNRRFVNIRQTGIYKGGYLQIVDISHAQLSSLVCEISDGVHQVRAETTIAINLAVSQATPYVILRWEHTGATSDYMEILVVATPSINDLVVGKCSFAGGGDLQGFDYNDASYPRSTPNTQDLFLKVEPTVDSELRVRIRAGRIQTSDAVVDIADQKSNLFTPPSSNSRVYLVYVTNSGAIAIDSTGTASSDPSPPKYQGRLVLAEVTISSGATNITSDMIKDVRNFLSSTFSKIENRTSDPSGSGLFAGRIWMRTDL